MSDRSQTGNREILALSSLFRFLCSSTSKFKLFLVGYINNQSSKLCRCTPPTCLVQLKLSLLSVTSLSDHPLSNSTLPPQNRNHGQPAAGKHSARRKPCLCSLQTEQRCTTTGVSPSVHEAWTQTTTHRLTFVLFLVLQKTFYDISWSDEHGGDVLRTSDSCGAVKLTNRRRGPPAVYLKYNSQCWQ